MPWTDKHGVTHEIVTYVDAYGTIRIVGDSSAVGCFGYGSAWMCCGVRAPPGSKESSIIVDCMTCLVRSVTQ